MASVETAHLNPPRFSAVMLRTMTALVLAGCACSSASAQSPELSWSALNSGSDLSLVGGPFHLGGTIGMAEMEILSGGPFRVVGGFWNPVSAIPCPADLNGDREVGLGDLTTLLANFGTPSGAEYGDGDINGNGAVSLDDLTVLLSEFGSICPE